MHYVVFLMSKGLVPYRDIADVNLPGSYVAEAVAMKLFGWGPLGWRLYDFVLMLILSIATVGIVGRKHWRAGLMAGMLFLIVHLQDGLQQAGQRDLVIAVLILAAYAALFFAQRRPLGGIAIMLFGLIAGATVTIKPLFLPLYLLLILISAVAARAKGVHAVTQISIGIVGLLAPGAGVLFWLWLRGGLTAFMGTVRFLIPYHASLGRKPFSYLLTHSVSPISVLVLVWLALLLWRRQRPSLERLELMLGVASALIAYVVQGKGYPYQRYPLLSLLLLLISMEIMEALNDEGYIKGFAVVAMAYACLVLAPLAVWRVQSFRGDQPFEQALAADLMRIGIHDVQCLDTFGGCINTLYDLRLVQSTGFLYDCYMFTPGHDLAAEQYRRQFWETYQRTRPRVLVMTNQYCFEPNSFQKAGNWPRFQDEIERSYVQVARWKATHPQHWWSRQELPPEYRIYARK